MTKEEINRLYEMVTSKNLDDVHFGMTIINEKTDIPLELLRYFWINSRCDANELTKWGIYNSLYLKVTVNYTEKSFDTSVYYKVNFNLEPYYDKRTV